MIADELKYRIRSAFGYEPTAEQQGAMDVFATFMVDSRMMPVMVMRGSAGTGYYVTPGGSPSTIEGSGARIPDGEYPIFAAWGKKWKKPGVGGSVIGRNIRFHHEVSRDHNPRKSTEGCFVLAYDYKKSKNGHIYFDREDSKSASRNFDRLLGGSCHFINGAYEGTKFLFPITAKLSLKSR